jgi:hypothetical protein
MALRGFVAIWWRRGNGAALVGAREGTDQGPADRLPPLPALCWQGSPAGGEVDGRADDISWYP